MKGPHQSSLVLVCRAQRTYQVAPLSPRPGLAGCAPLTSSGPPGVTALTRGFSTSVKLGLCLGSGTRGHSFHSPCSQHHSLHGEGNMKIRLKHKITRVQKSLAAPPQARAAPWLELRRGGGGGDPAGQDSGCRGLSKEGLGDDRTSTQAQLTWKRPVLAVTQQSRGRWATETPQG